MARRKVGLALGSGAARGLAHIGVLRVLQQENIPVDMIAGTSIGAVVGAVYAFERNLDRIEEVANNINSSRLLSLVDLTLSRTGLIGGRRILAWGKSLIGRDIQFSDLQIPFACIATDIITGQEIVFDKGSVMEAIRASFSIPGVFSLVKQGNKFLVDGGLVNPVPTSTVRDMGAQIIIAVNVMPDISTSDNTRWMGEKSKRGFKEPNIIEILLQSVYIGSHSLIQNSLKTADVVIEPKVSSIGPADFFRARECILQGELAAEDCIPKLKRLLSVR